jgi:TonB family protein
MPAKRGINNEFQSGKSKEVHTPVSKSESGDTLAADVSAGPINKSSDMKQLRRSNANEDTQADGIDMFETRQTEMPALFEIDEADHNESKFDLEDLNYEIEDILVELEQLKAKVVPMTDRRESKLATQAPLTTNPDSPSHSFVPQFNVEPAGSSAIGVPGEEWETSEFSKPDIEFPGGIRRWKKSILALIAIILVGVFGYFYFFPSDISAPASKLPAKNQRSEADKLPAPPAPSADTAIQEHNQTESSTITTADASSGDENTRPDLLNAARTGSPLSAVNASSAAKPKSQENASVRDAEQRDSAVSSNPAIPRRLAISSPGISSAAPASASPAISPPRDLRSDLSGDSVEKRETAQPKATEVSVANLVMAESISRVKPNYPVQAIEQKISGIVEVEVDINEKGDVVRAKAVSGPDLLRSAAEEALMKWKFKPASMNGISVSSQALISIPFNLR